MIDHQVVGLELCDCGHMESEHSYITRGYATTQDGKRLCYACADKVELEQRDSTGQWVAYLVEEQGKRTRITNWTGTISLNVLGVHKSKVGGYCYTERTDFWFITPDNCIWHGRSQGDMQLARCKRTKRTAPASLAD